MHQPMQTYHMGWDTTKSEKALAIPQGNLEVNNFKNKDDILPFISTYKFNNSNVFSKVREIYRNPQTSKTVGKAFTKHKLIDCKKQPSNLRRLLCFSNFSTNKPTFKTTKCGKSCFCWNYVIEGEHCKFKNWYQPFIFKSNLKCETPYLIYVIICSSCNKEYFGQTGGQFKERLSIYRQHIPQPKYEKIEVERHFRTYAKGILKTFPFFKMKKKNLKRKLRRSFY